MTTPVSYEVFTCLSGGWTPASLIIGEIEKTYAPPAAGTLTVNETTSSEALTAPGAPTATISSKTHNTATISWAPPSNTGGSAITGYAVGRDGIDATGGGPWSTVDSPEVRSRVFDKLQPNTVYNLSLRAINAQGQSDIVTLSVTTAAAPAGTIGGTPGAKSGLQWNSLVFNSSFQPDAFEQWRKRPVDGIMYFPGRWTWGNMAELPPRRAGDIMLYCVPPFPEGIGGSNSAVANGDYNTQIKNWAQALITAGWNTADTVIRLGWENNGTWYQWSWNKSGIEAFRNAYRVFVQQSRAQGLTDVKWNWNLNKGPQSAYTSFSWALGYPGDDVVDIVGIDPYDHAGPSFTDADWNTNIAGTGTTTGPDGKNPGLNGIAAFCRARGKKMSIDEWGPSHAQSWREGYQGGGDNPFYMHKMYEWCAANTDVLWGEVTYDDHGAPSTLKHKMSDGSNPAAAAAYLQTNRWGGS